jgi:hypothetical protein
MDSHTIGFRLKGAEQSGQLEHSLRRATGIGHDQTSAPIRQPAASA